MPAHTPGPWTLIEPLGEVWQEDTGVPILHINVELPDEVWPISGTGVAERLATLKLISAAPELLSSLKALLDLMEEYGDSTSGFSVAGEVFPQVKDCWAAIAKAEGK